VGPADERIMMAASALDVQHAVEQFLFREARLMDTNDYDAWLALWSDDCTYWVPCNDDGSDPSRRVSLVFAHRKQLEDRVWRLNGLHAHTQRPQSRLARVISNVEVEHAEDPEITVHSAFSLCEVRKDEMHFWVGRNTHVLERTDDGFSIKSKKVVLVNNDTAIPNLTFII
jgi:3-phenylpropionate/cinnamic acid dioxygenase small subunit